jgi:hypothetical protein
MTGFEFQLITKWLRTPKIRDIFCDAISHRSIEQRQ